MKISLISENKPEFVNIGADATVIEGNYPYLALYCFVKSRPGNSVELSKALFPTQKEPNKSFHIYHKQLVHENFSDQHMLHLVDNALQ